MNGDWAQPDIYEVIKRKARKAHVCCACFQTIKPGDLYHSHEFLFEKEWYRQPACGACQDAIDRFPPSPCPEGLLQRLLDLRDWEERTDIQPEIDRIRASRREAGP